MIDCSLLFDDKLNEKINRTDQEIKREIMQLWQKEVENRFSKEIDAGKLNRSRDFSIFKNNSMIYRWCTLIKKVNNDSSQDNHYREYLSKEINEVFEKNLNKIQYSLDHPEFEEMKKELKITSELEFSKNLNNEGKYSTKIKQSMREIIRITKNMIDGCETTEDLKDVRNCIDGIRDKSPEKLRYPDQIYANESDYNNPLTVQNSIIYGGFSQIGDWYLFIFPRNKKEFYINKENHSGEKTTIAFRLGKRGHLDLLQVFLDEKMASLQDFNHDDFKLFSSFYEKENLKDWQGGKYGKYFTEMFFKKHELDNMDFDKYIRENKYIRMSPEKYLGPMQNSTDLAFESLLEGMEPKP